ASHPDDIVTELAGIRLGHSDILPAHPKASHIRCHLPLQQPPACTQVDHTLTVGEALPSS
ncbi:hypothetical protein, partial [Nocardia farcinica]|uniref:hypothetical protein n=1 Tax=Nocardia farcinica TaxID=37329 RepID=UPI001E3B4457